MYSNVQYFIKYFLIHKLNNILMKFQNLGHKYYNVNKFTLFYTSTSIVDMTCMFIIYLN